MRNFFLGLIVIMLFCLLIEVHETGLRIQNAINEASASIDFQTTMLTDWSYADAQEEFDCETPEECFADMMEWEVY